MTDLQFHLSREVTDYSLTTRQRAISVLRMLKPYDFDAHRKKRFGRAFDGGYVMIDDFDGVSAAYSIGILDDVSWDMDMANLGIDLYQYDHTIDRLPAMHPRFNWEKIGLSDVSDEDRSLQRLDELMTSNEHNDAGDLILKCDIEGHEWGVLSGLNISTLKKFRQIIIEMHALQELSSSYYAEIMRKAVINLTANHNVVHVHANNWAPWAILGSIPVPTVIELTLLRKDRGIFLPSSETFPTNLDMPNNPDRPDFPLGSFLF